MARDIIGSSDIDKAVEQIEQIVHPEGRCAVCGGGKPYWKHNATSAADFDHAFVPPERDVSSDKRPDDTLERVFDAVEDAMKRDNPVGSSDVRESEERYAVLNAERDEPVRLDGKKFYEDRATVVPAVAALAAPKCTCATCGLDGHWSADCPSVRLIDISSDPVDDEPRHAHHDQGVDWDAVECLVDAAIRSGKITVSRGAEILGLQLRTWRERAAEIEREGNPYALAEKPGCPLCWHKIEHTTHVIATNP